MVRMKELPKQTERTYEIKTENFKKTLGLPKSKELSWVFLNTDGTVEIKVRE